MLKEHCLGIGPMFGVKQLNGVKMQKQKEWQAEQIEQEASTSAMIGSTEEEQFH